MTWELAFQTFTAALASLGGWFMYDLVKEFKSFKKDTSRDIAALQSERENFKVTVQNAELNIALRVTDLQQIHNEFSLAIKSDLQELKNEITEIRSISNQSLRNTRNQAELLKKNLEYSRQLNERLKFQEKEMLEIQQKIHELIG